MFCEPYAIIRNKRLKYGVVLIIETHQFQVSEEFMRSNKLLEYAHSSMLICDVSFCVVSVLHVNQDGKYAYVIESKHIEADVGFWAEAYRLIPNYVDYLIEFLTIHYELNKEVFNEEVKKNMIEELVQRDKQLNGCMKKTWKMQSRCVWPDSLVFRRMQCSLQEVKEDKAYIDKLNTNLKKRK